jgi:cell division protein ZapA (FtsZ GTPase activity inhibitor)
LSNPVHVTIYGQHFTVRTGEDPQRVEALAERVDKLMKQIANRGVFDSGRAAVLACLHLADELERLEREVEALKQMPDQKRKLNDLLQLLDEELK